MTDEDRLLALHDRFSSHGPCKSLLTGTLAVAPAETPKPEPRIWPKPSTTAGRGPYRKHGRTGPNGICPQTGEAHRLMKNGYDNCGNPRIRCAHCPATWKAGE